MLRDRALAGIRQIARTDLGKKVWKWWAHRRADVYLLSYPKCGRTWLRLMMGTALVDHLSIDCDPMELGRFHRLSDGVVPRIRITHDDLPQRKQPDDIERDKRRYADKRVIFLVRDPRDTLVSWYFQAAKRHERYRSSGTLGEFMRAPVGSLDSIIAYYNAWAENRDVPKAFCLVRYEDLHRDPITEVTRALQLLGQVLPTEVLARAVEFSRFDNMRKLEEAGKVGANDRLRPANSADPESFKTRKGKVGGFRDYLSAEEIAYLNDRIADRLSPFYADYRVPR